MWNWFMGLHLSDELLATRGFWERNNQYLHLCTYSWALTMGSFKNHGHTDQTDLVKSSMSHIKQKVILVGSKLVVKGSVSRYNGNKRWWGWGKSSQKKLYTCMKLSKNKFDKICNFKKWLQYCTSLNYRWIIFYI